MMSKRVDEPARGDVYAELVPAILLAILDLPKKGLAAGHVVVGHDGHAEHELQPALRHELAKGGSFLRVAFQERFDVRDLIEHETVGGLGLEKAQCLENVGQAHLQVFLASLEDGS